MEIMIVYFKSSIVPVYRTKRNRYTTNLKGDESYHPTFLGFNNLTFMKNKKAIRYKLSNLWKKC